jgi:P-type E1-E2 ATPase
VNTSSYHVRIACGSCFHDLWPFGPWVQVLPLLFVLAVSTLKEAFEYHRSLKADKRTNESLTYRLTVEGLWEELAWQDVHVGDILQLRNRDVVPADLILLCSSTDGGSCFVDTAQLDGETNLKIRQVRARVRVCA